MNAAHWHLVLNHVPVVGAVFAALLLLWSLVRRSDELKRTALGAVVLVTLSCFPAYFTGESAADAVKNLPGVNAAWIEPHDEAAAKAFTALFIAGVAALAGLIWRRRSPLPNWMCCAVLGLLLTAVALMVWAANLGGKIRHPELSETAARSQ
ncbi:MAG: hypothetical protein FJ386_09440 [Verrucomicrobia bacterium]|nr:hypothetical protein [Verrucomicrobiota bacterium]